uniref:Peptidoglycan-associated lipoprotein n=1 Tax=Candidatus Kentrum sp. FM TaxID=2126340 RepID=A0A450TNW2_9GAMM|nr:MAG: peptidoglycan-associated lipoprotein [Candidatus Kentron sp. FM]VFJ70609.1 MAG: peptidoglycan-associated lipoprotein [Candidatus Kentron sp. FM]VFK18310.1 MAG: peptidoglycan-associated lipoprotein [Candidatus Kentron sp. FM]
MNKRIAQLVAIGFSSLALISCESFSAKDESDQSAIVEDKGVYAGGIDVSEPAISPLDDPSSLLSKRTIYFDLDQSNIKPEYREIIDAHTRYLSDNPSIRVELIGHCDERGTPEYNLALGERRAKAVSQSMSVLGVPYNQLTTNSYGEEQPAVLGHNEAAWAQNRRVEILYPNR